MNSNISQRLLDHIYAAAWDPGALDEALRALAHTCRSRSAGLFRLRNGMLAWDQAWNMPEGFIHDFAANAAPRDPRVQFSLSQAPMTLMRDDDPVLRRAMCDNGIDTFARSYDLPYTVSTMLDQPVAGDALALYVSRSTNDGRPDDAQLEAFTRYAPHFARSMALRRRMHDDLLLDATTLAESGAPALGVLAMDHHGCVRWLDGSARQLLETSQGIALRGSRLRFDNTADQRFFEAMQPTATSHENAATSVLHLAQQRPPGMLSLCLTPHPCATYVTRAPILVRLRRNFSPQQDLPLNPRPQPTPRQHEVLTLLAQGLMSKQIGDRLGIAENTVRNHIQQLLRLFDVHTRTACVARARLHRLVD